MPKADKMIALSGYCKSKQLSLPSSFKVDDFIETLSDDDYVISGYKFKESVLDKIVPSLKLKTVKKVHTLDKHLYVFRFKDTDSFMLVYQDSKTHFENIVSSVLEDIYIEKIKIYGSRSNGDKIIEALTILEDSVFKTGINNHFHDIIGSTKTKFYVGKTNGEDILSIILTEKTELEFNLNKEAS